MVHKLYGATGRGSKIVAVAKYNGIEIEAVNINFGVDNKTPEFLQKNPTGKVPVLETSEGSIFESNAIVRYIARAGGKLYGKNNFEAGQIDQWIDFAVNEIELPASAWLYPIWGFVAENKQATHKAKEDVKKVFEILDSHFITRTYIVGNSISIADIVVFQAVRNLYSNVLDAAFRKDFVNANRWFTTIGNQPIIKSVYGEVTFAEKVAVAQAPKKAEKEQKPKQEQKPKEEKPKPAAKETEEEPEDEHKEVEKKSPLDALPKSSFVFDEWKRTYSNKDTRGEALPWFFANYDPAGYVIYHCDYKYNNELSKVFMTNNLIGGWFQRLDSSACHKHMFASMCIFGTEPSLTLSGVWIFRGQEIPELMTSCDDNENYVWTKLDIANEHDKKKIGDYFAWDGFTDQPFAAGKVFK